MKTTLLALVLSTYSCLLFATTIVPAPFSRLVSDADAVIEGTYRESVTRVLSSGEVVTEISLEVKRYAGLNSNELYNPKNFKVYYPGGTYNNRVVRVQSAPSFFKDEHVMLFLEKKSFGYLIQNLSLGKFNFSKKIGEKAFYTSSLFPNHPELGRIEEHEVQQIVEKRFNRKFVIVESNYNRNILSNTEENEQLTRSREIASIKEHKEFSMKNNIIVIIGVLSFLIILSFVVRRKQRIK